MKILSTIAIQMEPALAAVGGAKTQATSPGSVNRNGSSVEQRSASPVQGEKPSVGASNPIDAEDVNKALKELNEQMNYMNRSIQFSVDDQTSDIIVKVVDKSSGEVISQIPPEEILKLRENMEDMTGLLIKKTV